MDCSTKKNAWGLLLGLAITGCGPAVSIDGEPDDTAVIDEAHACTPDDSPIPCVRQDGEGCLHEPVGDATCTDGRWSCAGEWTAPQVDAEDYCTVPPLEDCEGEPVVCTNQSASGECADYWVDAYAFCVDSEWQCPPGFHDDAVHCSWPEYPDEPNDPEPPTQCTQGDQPPLEQADCYDQGPGECADATQPPSCTSGEWVCPAGWAFGNYGEGCTWPGE